LNFDIKLDKFFPSVLDAYGRLYFKPTIASGASVFEGFSKFEY